MNDSSEDRGHEGLRREITLLEQQLAMLPQCERDLEHLERVHEAKVHEFEALRDHVEEFRAVLAETEAVAERRASEIAALTAKLQQVESALAERERSPLRRIKRVIRRL